MFPLHKSLDDFVRIAGKTATLFLLNRLRSTVTKEET